MTLFFQRFYSQYHKFINSLILLSLFVTSCSLESIKILIVSALPQSDLNATKNQNFDLGYSQDQNLYRYDLTTKEKIISLSKKYPEHKIQIVSNDSTTILANANFISEIDFSLQTYTELKLFHGEYFSKDELGFIFTETYLTFFVSALLQGTSSYLKEKNNDRNFEWGYVLWPTFVVFGLSTSLTFSENNERILIKYDYNF